MIAALDDEHDLHRMGGLRRELPVTFWTFLAGAASLSALPLVTAGFYSKDLILNQAWGSSPGGPLLWAAGMAGAFLTGLYTFRMVFLAFFGEIKTPVIRKPGTAITVSLVVLALFSLVSGFLQMPALIAPVTVFSDFLSRSLPPAAAAPLPHTTEIMLFLSAAIVPVVGAACRLVALHSSAGPLGADCAETGRRGASSVPARRVGLRQALRYTLRPAVRLCRPPQPR